MRGTALTSHKQQLSWGRLLWIGPYIIFMCIGVNCLIRLAAVADGVPDAFQPLQLPAITTSTIVYLLLAIGALIVVSRVSARPRRTYRILAVVCLLFSLLFPLMALIGIVPIPGMTESFFWSMVAMHIMSAFLAIIGLPVAIVRR